MLVASIDENVIFSPINQNRLKIIQVRTNICQYLYDVDKIITDLGGDLQTGEEIRYCHSIDPHGAGNAPAVTVISSTDFLQLMLL